MDDRGRSQARATAVTVVLLLGLLAAGVPVAAPSPAHTQAGFSVADSLPQQGPSQPEADHTVTRIAVAANGTAVWTVQIWTRLESESDVAGYRDFQASFRSNASRYVDPFRARMRRSVESVGNATGRDMAVRGFEASTSIQEVPRRWGVVTYEFTWTNFAADQGDGLVVGDVFVGGFFLARNDTLQLVTPAGYAVESADPQPDGAADGVVTWEGQRFFDDGHPRVRMVPTGTAQPPPGGDGGDEMDRPALPRDPVILGVGAIAAVAVFALAGVLARRWRKVGPQATGPGDGAGPAGTESSTTGEGATEPGTAESGVTETGPTGPAYESPDVLRDSDRVVSLLEEHGGRMRQGDVKDAMGWSKSKTSRVLSDMAEEGSVEKIQIGRENIVTLVADDRDE